MDIDAAVKDLLEPYPVIFENGAGRIYKLD